LPSKLLGNEAYQSPEFEGAGLSRSTRITLICHAATAATRSAGFPADEPLLEGQGEAVKRIRAALPHAHAFLSGSELRTRETAAMLTGDFAIDPIFRDLDCGRWRGKGLAEIQEREPESLMAWVTDIEAVPHGGESIASCIRRIADRLAGQMSAGGHSVIVTHAAVIRAAILSVLDAPRESFWKLDVQPLAVAEITSDGRRWALRSFGNLLD
jgi:broad specificity phosphatase PhoE